MEQTTQPCIHDNIYTNLMKKKPLNDISTRYITNSK